MALTTTDGSKTLYSYFPEATAATPVAGAYQTLRSKLGVKIDLKRDTFMSKERRSDRMESSMAYGNSSGTVAIPVEWSYGTYDDLIAAVMGDATAAGSSSWGSNICKIGNTVKTYSMEETSSELGITEVGLGMQLGSFSISQKINGIAEGDFSGLVRDVRACQTTGVNIAVDATAKTITRSTAGFNTVDGFPLVTAGVPVLKVSMKGNTDAGNNDTIWTVTTLTDTVISFTTMAGAVTKTATAGITVNQASNSTSYAAATTIAPFDSFTGTIQEGGATIAHVTGWDLKVENNLQPNFALGSDTPQSVSTGVIKVSGNLTVYYIDQALRKKFINGNSTTLKLILGSVAATKAYTFDLGTVKYTSNSRDDNELARTESLAFAATFTTTDTTLKVTRTP